MLRIQSALVTLFTISGFALMVLAFIEAVRAEGIVGADFMILSAIGAVISTVGLSASMIVSAIRDRPGPA